MKHLPVDKSAPTPDVRIEAFKDALHRDQVITLWKTVFAYEAPHNHPALVIDKKLEVRDQLFFVAVQGAEVVGTTMAGYDGHRGWIYSVAVHPAHRKKGIGSRLMAYAERALAHEGCVKINLIILEGNEGVMAFYASLGYAAERRINMGKYLPENIPASPARK
jgi:ribosomal protein S18 acetylase RimI-like enzyme